MTNIYARISDGDAPKTQQVTQVSFVDDSGKHIDIGASGENGYCFDQATRNHSTCK